jgi:hypothetical protein
MIIILYVIFVAIVLISLGHIFNFVEHAEKYKPAGIFLLPIIKKLQAEYPKYELLSEDDGSVKYCFYSTNYQFTVDFIYTPTDLQIKISFDSNLNNTYRVENCPYQMDIIERTVNDIITSLQTFVC